LKIKDTELKPILMGRHLIELGVQPGEQMGVILRNAFEAQIAGDFDDLDDAINWYRKQEETDVD
jgi:tRNA nucleotidyltransferase (CCA-adding enzyme)